MQRKRVAPRKIVYTAFRPLQNFVRSGRLFIIAIDNISIVPNKVFKHF